jgi:hypothetical protein
MEGIADDTGAAAPTVVARLDRRGEPPRRPPQPLGRLRLARRPRRQAPGRDHRPPSALQRHGNLLDLRLGSSLCPVPQDQIGPGRTTVIA